MPGALEGLKVIDLSRVLGGPYCGQMLADHGADVLKISRPGGGGSTGAGGGASKGPLGRGRRSVGIDLRHEHGADTFLRLVADADAVISALRRHAGGAR